MQLLHTIWTFEVRGAPLWEWMIGISFVAFFIFALIARVYIDVDWCLAGCDPSQYP